MPNEEIVIDIHPNGDVTIEGKNFVGPECKAITKALEADFGEVTRVEEKPEFHRTTTSTNVRKGTR